MPTKHTLSTALQPGGVTMNGADLHRAPGLVSETDTSQEKCKIKMR